jgi:lysyl-tRNA synthetase class I
VAREAIYRRMYAVLSGQDQAPRYARLTTADRRAIMEILRETKTGLPEYFR